ncbi:VOC family protein [Beggiatoa alba]|nr:VOC family protein [Beggiatoa alba]
MSDPTQNTQNQNQPPATAGLRHVALYVENFDACEKFYVELLGMQIEWRPDNDNVYLTSGNDNLALHRAETKWKNEKMDGPQRLDHIGYILKQADDVDEWYAFLHSHHVKMHSTPKTHRDAARSFYCADPDGNVVQMIYHPPIANT